MLNKAHMNTNELSSQKRFELSDSETKDANCAWAALAMHGLI
jgi:hypothetical protein